MSYHIAKLELPLEVVEPIFTLLHNLKPSQHTQLEMKAVNYLKSALLFELERLMLEPDEEAERKINFEKLFEKQRQVRDEKIAGKTNY